MDSIATSVLRGDELLRRQLPQEHAEPHLLIGGVQLARVRIDTHDPRGFRRTGHEEPVGLRLGELLSPPVAVAFRVPVDTTTDTTDGVALHRLRRRELRRVGQGEADRVADRPVLPEVLGEDIGIGLQIRAVAELVELLGQAQLALVDDGGDVHLLHTLAELLFLLVAHYVPRAGRGTGAGDDGQQVAYIITDEEGGDIFGYWLIDGEACPLPCTTATEFAWPPVDRYLDFATGKVVDIRTGEEVLYTGDMRHVIFFER